MQHMLLVYRRFVTFCQSHLDNLKIGPKDCPETSVRNYEPTLRNTPEEQRVGVHPGGSLKFSNMDIFLQITRLFVCN